MLIALLLKSTSNHLICNASPGSAKVSLSVCKKVANSLDFAEDINASNSVSSGTNDTSGHTNLSIRVHGSLV